MARQYSTAVRNAKQDAVTTVIGASPLLRIRTGSLPANCAASRTGTILVTMTLPSTAFAATSSGVRAKSGTWSGTAGNTGTAGYYEIMDSTGTTCHEQGTVTATGGGGDMTVDNTSIASGQTVTDTTYSCTEGGA